MFRNGNGAQQTNTCLDSMVQWFVGENVHTDAAAEIGFGSLKHFQPMLRSSENFHWERHFAVVDEELKI